jgi:hypothetical protein
MRTLKLFVFIYLPLLVISCEELFNLTGDNSDLTTEEVVEGLKTALEIGTDTATSVLGLVDGYYGSELLKIPLPPEAEQVRQLITNNAISQYFNLDDQFENVIISINRAAEEAAKEAGGVFKGAITDLSISDGWELLQGEVPSNLKSTASEFDSTAATEYFKIKTYDTLTYMYGLKINNALDQPLGALNFSATQAWTTLINSYNTAYNTVNSNFLTRQLISQYNLPNGINDNLGEFCTEKALDGLFLKVGDEEKKIRRDPFKWAVDIIQKVFGSIL